MTKIYIDDEYVGEVTNEVYNTIYKSLEIYVLSIGGVLSETEID